VRFVSISFVSVGVCIVGLIKVVSDSIVEVKPFQFILR